MQNERFITLTKRLSIPYFSMLLECCNLYLIDTLKWKWDTISYDDSSPKILVWCSSLYTTLFIEFLHTSLERVAFLFATKHCSNGTFLIPYIALFLFLLMLTVIYFSTHLKLHLSPNLSWSWRINLFFCCKYIIMKK